MPRCVLQLMSETGSPLTHTVIKVRLLAGQTRPSCLPQPSLLSARVAFHATLPRALDRMAHLHLQATDSSAHPPKTKHVEGARIRLVNSHYCLLVGVTED